MINRKLITKPKIYEIEILETSNEIPKKEEINFIEWLNSLTEKFPCGKGSDYFSYSDSYKDDIEIVFEIKLFEIKLL